MYEDLKILEDDTIEDIVKEAIKYLESASEAISEVVSALRQSADEYKDDKVWQISVATIKKDFAQVSSYSRDLVNKLSTEKFYPISKGAEGTAKLLERTLNALETYDGVSHAFSDSVREGFKERCEPKLKSFVEDVQKARHLINAYADHALKQRLG